MSVPVGKRGEGQLQVLRLITDLTVYTMKTLRREDAIPKSSRWIMSSAIARERLNAYVHVRKANIIRVDPEKYGYKAAKKSFRERRSHQKKAYASLESMLVSSTLPTMRSGSLTARWKRG